jgi:hypothetical protein
MPERRVITIAQSPQHTQASATQRYAHLFADVQREAVERAGAVITGNDAESAELVPLRR